jgi:hypothetical protein
MADIREFVNRSLPRFERGCATKARFDSRRDANSMARHGHHQDGSSKPYRCEFCGCWHLGHKRRFRWSRELAA